MSLPILYRIVGVFCLLAGGLALLSSTSVLLRWSPSQPSFRLATMLAALAFLPAGVASLIAGVGLFSRRREGWDRARAALWVAAVAFGAACLAHGYALQQLSQDMHWAENADRNQDTLFGGRRFEAARSVRQDMEAVRIELVVMGGWALLLALYASLLPRFPQETSPPEPPPGQGDR